MRILADRGTKKMGPDFGVLQFLESQGIRFVVILDGNDAGAMAAEAMSRFGAQKNRHFFQLARPDYRDKGGRSWDVEIEDLLPQAPVEAFVQEHPDCVEERMQRRDVLKFVINGKPVEKGGQTYDYKMMLAGKRVLRGTRKQCERMTDKIRKIRRASLST